MKKRSAIGGVIERMEAASAGFVGLTASLIQDAAGNRLASGTLEVLPTDGSNVPVTAAAGGAGGQMSSRAPAIFTITGGVLQAGAQIADTTQTKPANICYRFTIKDATGNPIDIIKLVQTAANTTFNLDTYQPNVATQAIIQTGPPGQSLNFRGAWVANTLYSPYDVVTNGGQTYLVPPGGGFTSGSVFNPANYALMAASGTAGASSVGLPVFTTTAAGIAGGTGAALNAYFLVPSSSIDGLYDVYVNASGVAAFQQTLPRLTAASGGAGLLDIYDKLGNGLTLLDLTGNPPALSATQTQVANILSGQAGLVAQGGTTPLSIQDKLGNVWDAADVNGLAAGVGANTAAIASLTSASYLSPTYNRDARSAIGGTSTWANGTHAASVNAVNGFVPIVAPSDSYDLQVAFASVFGSESPGPSGSLRASIEYPAGVFRTVNFNGKRVASAAPGSLPTSDIVSMNLPAGQVALCHFQFRRAVGDSTPIPAGWVYGYMNGSGVLGSGNTNTRNGGNFFDAIEPITERSITDATFSGTTLTSSSAAFTYYEVNQTATLSDGSTRRYSFVSATQATLSAAPNGGVSSTVILSATDKTLGTADYAYASGTNFAQNGVYVSGFAPLAVFGKSKTNRSFLALGDSITWGQGLSAAGLTVGSWFEMGLSYGNGANTNVRTKVLVSIPSMNVSMPGDTASDISTNHAARLSHGKRFKYTVGMLGTNDLGNSYLAGADVILETSMLVLWAAIAALGSRPVYSTIIPRSTSTDSYATAGNQTTVASNPSRILFNSWMMDGAPISNATGAPVVVGSSSATTNRCNVYSATGAIVSEASGPGVHPCFAIFDMASLVDAGVVAGGGPNGLWRTDLGQPTPDGVHPLLVLNYAMAGAFASILKYLT